MPKFSAHLTQLFTERPFADRFAAAARHGFVACEFRSPFEHPPAEVAAWSRDAALPIILFNAPAGNWASGERGIAAIPGREAAFRDSIDRAVRYLDALDVPMLHVMAGIAPSPTEDHRRTFVGNLKHAARQLAASGRTVLIEPLNTHDTPHYYLASQAEAHAIREDAGEPNLFVQMDCYHVERMGDDIAGNLKARIAGIRHIQIAGVPGRHEPDSGTLDYAPIFELIDALDYRGWVGCEYVPRAGTEMGLSWMKTACEASPR